jgi:hypothetical protein
MKLNLGCGHNRLDGWTNVDSVAGCEPDEVVDLEQIPWPWSDSSAEAVLFNHSLEHMGAAPAQFLAIIKELYRVCADGAVVRINAPHPRHDNFIGDPTHVRIVTPQVLSLFSRRLNDEWKRTGAANTPFAHYLEVDFEIVEVRTMLDEPYATEFREGRMTEEALQRAISTSNNVVRELQMQLVVRKP